MSQPVLELVSQHLLNVSIELYTAPACSVRLQYKSIYLFEDSSKLYTEIQFQPHRQYTLYL
jgi:hypothetical protein